MIEVVLTSGPGVMEFHAFVDRARAMVLIECLPKGYEVIMSPADIFQGREVRHA